MPCPGCHRIIGESKMIEFHKRRTHYNLSASLQLTDKRLLTYLCWNKSRREILISNIKSDGFNSSKVSWIAE